MNSNSSSSEIIVNKIIFNPSPSTSTISPPHNPNNNSIGIITDTKTMKADADTTATIYIENKKKKSYTTTKMPMQITEKLGTQEKKKQLKSPVIAIDHHHLITKDKEKEPQNQNVVAESESNNTNNSRSRSLIEQLKTKTNKQLLSNKTKDLVNIKIKTKNIITKEKLETNVSNSKCKSLLTKEENKTTDLTNKKLMINDLINKLTSTSPKKIKPKETERKAGVGVKTNKLKKGNGIGMEIDSVGVGFVNSNRRSMAKAKHDMIDYVNQIKSAIESNFYLNDLYRDKICELRITIDPNGTLVNIYPQTNLKNDRALCDAAIRAAKITRIPKPPNHMIYDMFNEQGGVLVFKP